MINSDKTTATVFFYTCILACEMIKYFGSWGRHMQNIVNQRCVAGGGQCL